MSADDNAPVQAREVVHRAMQAALHALNVLRDRADGVTGRGDDTDHEQQEEQG